MNFEDRLRDHLTDQGQTIEINPEGPEAAIGRHARRARNRMAASAAAVALVFVGGFGLWSLSDRPAEQQTSVTGETETSEAESSEDAAETSMDDSGEGNGEATAGSTQIEVVERLDENAPSGAWESRVDGGNYYVLSTAPGQVFEPDENNYDYGLYRPNTIYRFDPESGWTNAEITDRWISDFAPSNGVLYVLSTGRVDGTLEGAFGVSNDQGATWDWRPVPALDEFTQATDEYDVSPTTLRLLPVADRSYLLAQTIGWPDWDEALNLARDAGFDVSRQQVMDINQDGIIYNPVVPDGEDVQCWDIMDRFHRATSELWEEFESEIGSEEEYLAIADELEPRIAEIGQPFEAELIAAGCTNEIACDRIQQQYWNIGRDLWTEFAPSPSGSPEDFDEAAWDEINSQVQALQAEQGPAIEAELEAAGCENRIKCDRISQAGHENASDEQEAINEQYERYDQLSEDERRNLDIRSQALWARIEAEIRPALQAAGCLDPMEQEMAMAEPEMNPEQFERVTWDELGVETPDSWGSNSQYFELRDGELLALDAPFDGETVVNTTNGPTGVQVVSLPSSSYFGLPDAQPQASVWTTNDGVTWSRTGSSSNPYGGSGGGGPGPVSAGDVSLRIQWDMPSLPSIVRTGDTIVQADAAVDVASDAQVETDPQAFPVIPPDAEIITGEDGQPYFIDESGEQVQIPLPAGIPMPPSFNMERSVAGGPWEPIELGDLVPDLASNDGRVDQLIQSDAGIAFVIQPNGADEPSYVVYSGDGVTWNTTAMDAAWVSSVSVGDSVLFMGTRPTPAGQPPAPTATVLIRPAR